MLSIDRCRDYLGSDCPLTDEEIEAVRDQLYALATLAVGAGGVAGIEAHPQPEDGEA
jgi:hypothetical protein